MRRPGQWQKQMAQVDATTARGIRAYPMCTPNRITDYFQMRNTQTFRGMAVWHPICLSSPEEQLQGLCRPRSAPEAPRRGGRVQETARRSASARPGGTTWSCRPRCCRRTSGWRARPLGEIAKAQGKGIIDCLCDLTIEENLDTEWLHGENNVDDDAVAQDPDLPERGDRPVGRRRARAVPERLRLLDPAACRNGCARSRSCRWRPRCGG